MKKLLTFLFAIVIALLCSTLVGALCGASLTEFLITWALSTLTGIIVAIFSSKGD